MTASLIIITAGIRTMIRCLPTTYVEVSGINGDTCTWRVVLDPREQGVCELMSRVFETHDMASLRRSTDIKRRIDRFFSSNTWWRANGRTDPVKYGISGD